MTFRPLMDGSDTVTIVVEAEGQEPFEFELSAEQFALWESHAKARGLTMSQSFEKIIGDFIASHPIIAQTRTPQ